jgi:glucose dehydrogenase
MRPIFVTVALLACALTAAAQVSNQSLLTPDPQDWLMYSGTYNAHRHSPLKQLTPANVVRLRAAWVYHMAGQEAIQAVPIVHKGVMYVSQFNRIDAIDARSGNIVWQHQRPPLTRGAQRGTAIYNNKLFVTAADGAIVAVDSRTGHTVWETKVAPPWRLAGQAPLVARGKVIVSGNQPSGFIQAYDAESGKHVESPKPEEAWQLYVRALDATTGKKIWDYQQISSFHYGPGVLSTAGGLVFAGEHKGQISALDARTGKSVWHFNTGDLITSSPISYGIDGQQYIAISSAPTS